MVFPIVMYGCENWNIKKAECQRIDAVVLEKILESPLDCKEEIPLIQGKEHWLRFAGAAVKRYPMPKVRETQVRW